jgi:hypothetical protein
VFVQVLSVQGWVSQLFQGQGQGVLCRRTETDIYR